MTAIILFFALGLVLLCFEVFLPGAIMGIIGGILMLIGCGIAFSTYGTGGGIIASLSAAALVGLTLYVELRVIPRTRWGKKMFLEASIAGASQPPPAQAAEIVGRAGEALTTLAPTGMVLVDGRKYEAASQSGLLAKGAAVRVVAVESFRLIVSSP